MRVQGQQTTSGPSLASPESRRGPRDLLYVTANGTAYIRPHQIGTGVLVFDVRNNFEFVKRIPTWDVAASVAPELIVGIAASPATGLLYLTTSTRLAAFDLTTDKKAWEQSYDGGCCEMLALAPDGKMIYVAGNYKPYWYVVDAKTGALVKRVEYPKDFVGRKIERSHNIIWSRDGSQVFMSGSGDRDNTMAVADTETNTIVRAIGPFSDAIRPFTTNGRGTLLFANMVGLCGFEIADTYTGKVLHRVECSGDWKDKIKSGNITLGHGAPSHGVAMSPDEREIWVTDNVEGSLHVFDATVMPPKEVAQVKTRVPPYWVNFGLDGKYVFAMSGDVIDPRTRKIVAVLKDEYGRDVFSEKYVEAQFVDGKMTRATDRFGIGQVLRTATH
jgi:DNA-binding beta-propeller fold protein YncE